MGKLTNSLHLILLLLITVTEVQASVWQPVPGSTVREDIHTIRFHPQFPSIVFYGTANAVYRLNMDTQEEHAVLYPHGEQSRVNDILVSAASTVYAATDAGLYQSHDLGGTWDRAFQADADADNQCLSLWETDDRLWLGTASGLYYRSSGASAWQAMGGPLGHDAIHSIVDDGRQLYVATSHAVYQVQEANLGYSRLLTFGLSSRPEESSVEADGEGEILIRDLKDLRHGAGLLLSSRRGLFLSRDQGKNWIKLSLSGISESGITTALPIPTATGLGNCADPVTCLRLVIGTSAGAFLYEKGTSVPLYKGMETGGVNALTVSKRGSLFAATDAGLYSMGIEETLPIFSQVQLADYDELKSDFLHEPDIHEVHRLAIRYADVDNSKIARWKRQARLQAVLPNLSAGVDRAATDLLHWDTGQSPDVLVKGRDFLEWDAAVSWDLGDLIWSTDQTTIDSRAKLMVEMREEILDQITRLFFERRRLQMELATLNEPVTFDKKMRIDELTALIDALTGGEFSRIIEERRRLQ